MHKVHLGSWAGHHTWDERALMRGPLVGRPGGLGGSGALGAGNGYMGQSSRALFLPEPTRSCHCDLPVARRNDTGTHSIAAHARQEKDSNAFSKLYKMSTDAEDTKLFNGGRAARGVISCR